MFFVFDATLITFVLLFYAIFPINKYMQVGDDHAKWKAELGAGVVKGAQEAGKSPSDDVVKQPGLGEDAASPKAAAAAASEEAAGPAAALQQSSGAATTSDGDKLTLV